jgi:hypothetical protein
MIDEAKRKQLVIAATVFLGIVILAFIGFLVFFRQNDANDLPPIEPETSDTQQADQQNTSGTNVSSEEAKKSVSYKSGVTFNGFDELNRYAVTSFRRNTIEYVLSNYANNTTKADIYTFTPASVKEIPDGERTFLTFNITDNKNIMYKVELSYTFSADAYVRVFDKDDNIVVTSPFDSD